MLCPVLVITISPSGKTWTSLCGLYKTLLWPRSLDGLSISRHGNNTEWNPSKGPVLFHKKYKYWNMFVARRLLFANIFLFLMRDHPSYKTTFSSSEGSTVVCPEYSVFYATVNVDIFIFVAVRAYNTKQHAHVTGIKLTSLFAENFSHAVTHNSMASVRISSFMSECWKKEYMFISK